MQKLPGIPEKLEIAEAQAQRLHTAMSHDFTITHEGARDLVANLHGKQNWSDLKAAIENSHLSAQEPLQEPNISQEDHDIVLFENVSSIFAANKICQIFDAHEMDIISDICSSVERADGSVSLIEDDGKHYSFKFFKRMTLADLKMGEFKTHQEREVKSKKPYRISEALKREIDKDPDILKKDKFGSSSSGDVFKNHQAISNLYSGMTGYDVSRSKEGIENHHAHGIYTGESIQPLLDVFPKALDFTKEFEANGNRHTLKKIGDYFMVPYPDEGFSSPVDGLKLMIHMRQILTNELPRSKGNTEKRIIILSLSDLVANEGGDALMAIVRSQRVFVIVHADRFDLPYCEVEKIISQCNILMEPDLNSKSIMAKSGYMEESKGGRLKIHKPYKPLTFKDLFQNFMVNLRLA